MIILGKIECLNNYVLRAGKYFPRRYDDMQYAICIRVSLRSSVI
jgi:hypothetical protein